MVIVIALYLGVNPLLLTGFVMYCIGAVMFVKAGFMAYDEIKSTLARRRVSHGR